MMILMFLGPFSLIATGPCSFPEGCCMELPTPASIVLQRTRLSRRHMCWLLLPPLPLLVSKLSLFLSLPVCRLSSLLTGEREWEGEGEGAK
jgi:hypothetical protein